MGIKLQEQSAQTFLSTVVNASNSIPPRQGPADKDRICANILGLAVVASVKYAKSMETTALSKGDVLTNKSFVVT